MTFPNSPIGKITCCFTQMGIDPNFLIFMWTHTFLLNIPRLEFAALIPKGDYVSLALLGQDVDRELLQTFVNEPVVKRCLPPNFPMDQVACWCAPRINIKGSTPPFDDRIVFIGDSGVTRLYKDGIGAAYRTAKAAAKTAIFEGISAEDFRRHYWSVCRAMETDNSIGKVIFTVVRQMRKRTLTRRAVLRMVFREQQGMANPERGMSLVMWDMFTGSASYGEIFLRTLRPAFWAHLLRELLISLGSLAGGGTKTRIADTESTTSAPHIGAGIYTLRLLEEYALRTNGLGKLF